jgi:hypothetical protein
LITSIRLRIFAVQQKRSKHVIFTKYGEIIMEHQHLGSTLAASFDVEAFTAMLRADFGAASLTLAHQLLATSQGTARANLQRVVSALMADEAA